MGKQLPSNYNRWNNSITYRCFKKHAACQQTGCVIIHNFLLPAILIVWWLDLKSSDLSILHRNMVLHIQMLLFQLSFSNLAGGLGDILSIIMFSYLNDKLWETGSKLRFSWGTDSYFMREMPGCVCTILFLVVAFWFPFKHLVSPVPFPFLTLFLTFEYHLLVHATHVVWGKADHTHGGRSWMAGAAYPTVPRKQHTSIAFMVQQ